MGNCTILSQNRLTDLLKAWLPPTYHNHKTPCNPQFQTLIVNPNDKIKEWDNCPPSPSNLPTALFVNANGQPHCKTSVGLTNSRQLTLNISIFLLSLLLRTVLRHLKWFLRKNVKKAIYVRIYIKIFTGVMQPPEEIVK